MNAFCVASQGQLLALSKGMFGSDLFLQVTNMKVAWIVCRGEQLLENKLEIIA